MKSELNKSGSNVSRTLGLGYFNLARGLGMVLIVLGHSINLYLESKNINFRQHKCPSQKIGKRIFRAPRLNYFRNDLLVSNRHVLKCRPLYTVRSCS